MLNFEGFTDACTAAAYHEAGHVVMAWRQGKWIRDGGIVINADGTGIAYLQPCTVPVIVGHMLTTSPADAVAARFLVEQELRELMAGNVAEALHEVGWSFDALDLLDAEAFATQEPSSDSARIAAFLLLFGDKADRIFDSCLRETYRALRRAASMAAVRAIAHALLQGDGHLAAGEVETFLRCHLQTRRSYDRRERSKLERLVSQLGVTGSAAQFSRVLP